jgi:hypothetical protein
MKAHGNYSHRDRISTANLSRFGPSWWWVKVIVMHRSCINKDDYNEYIGCFCESERWLWRYDGVQLGFTNPHASLHLGEDLDGDDLILDRSSGSQGLSFIEVAIVGDALHMYMSPCMTRVHSSTYIKICWDLHRVLQVFPSNHVICLVKGFGRGLLERWFPTCIIWLT